MRALLLIYDSPGMFTSSTALSMMSRSGQRSPSPLVATSALTLLYDIHPILRDLFVANNPSHVRHFSSLTPSVSSSPVLYIGHSHYLSTVLPHTTPKPVHSTLYPILYSPIPFHFSSLFSVLFSPFFPFRRVVECLYPSPPHPPQKCNILIPVFSPSVFFFLKY